MIPRSECGSGGCDTCPFSYGEAAEQVQNYGCLPDRKDILVMKEESGHNWACHGDETVLCGGYARYLKKNRPDLDPYKGNLISYDTWYRYGKDAAMMEAEKYFVPKTRLDDLARVDASTLHGKTLTLNYVDIDGKGFLFGKDEQGEISIVSVRSEA